MSAIIHPCFVGKSLGTGCWAIIHDGDSVLCEFPGSDGRGLAELVLAAIDAARQQERHCAEK